MNRSIFRFLVFLLVVIALGAGCGPKPSGALRVGINPWPGYEFLYLAQEKGFYREQGVEVRLLEFATLSDCRRAYERGQIDAMGSTIIQLLQCRDQSERSPQVVKVVDYSDGADLILAQPEIKSVGDLRGKRVGVEMDLLGSYVLARGLEKAGLSRADVTVVTMDLTSMFDVYGKGELDAVVSYPPFSTKLLREAKAHPVFSTAEIPGEVLDVVAVEKTVAEQRGADVAKLLRAFDQAVAFAKANPAAACKIMAEREGVTVKEFEEALTDGVVVVGAAEQGEYFKAGGKLEQSIDKADRILRKDGMLKGPDRRAGMINLQFGLPAAAGK